MLSTVLRALSCRMRQIIHRLWLGDQPSTMTGCVYCTSWNGKPHDPWCPRAGAR